MAIKKLDDGRYEVDIRPRGPENASAGNSKEKLKH